MKASGKFGMWTGRLLALAVAIIIPACGNPTGRPVTTGIQWNSQASSGVNATGPGPAILQWVDPNLGLGGGQIGITQLISSQDTVTYARYNISTRPPPFNTFISYIFALEHPLATDTSSGALTQRESELEGLINSFRGMGTPIICVHMPNATGGGAAGGVGGMGVNTGGSPLPAHQKGTLCARAHCKHYAYYHGGFPGGLPGGVPAIHFSTPEANAEGDTLLFAVPGTPAYTDGTPAPGNTLSRTYGRLGKIGVRANKNGWGEYSISGIGFPDALKVYDEMLLANPDILQFVNWTNLCVGHWIGGPRAYYWNIFFLIFPVPSY